MKKTKRTHKDKMLKEYDFSKGVRGKYVNRFASGSNIIALDPDVSKTFSDSKIVNQILRAIAASLHQKSNKKWHSL